MTTKEKTQTKESQRIQHVVLVAVVTEIAYTWLVVVVLLRRVLHVLLVQIR